MRFIRAIVIGFLSIFPGTITGYLGWLATGASENNYSPAVVFFCNIVPLGSVFVGFKWTWANGAEYGVDYRG